MTNADIIIARHKRRKARRAFINRALHTIAISIMAINIIMAILFLYLFFPFPPIF